MNHSTDMPDNYTKRTTKKRLYGYKHIVAAIAGLLCFFLSKYGFSITIDETIVHIPWSLVFPVLIASAYGLRYGLLAGFLGAAFYPFYIWEINGWANVLISIYLLVLFAGIGFYSDYRLQHRKKNRLIWVMLAILVSYIVFLYVCTVYIYNSFLALNPPFWTGDAVNSYPKSILQIFFIKNTLNLLLIILFSESLLHIKVVRNIFRLPVSYWMDRNGKVFSLSIFVAFIIWGVIVVLDHFLLSNNQGLNPKYHTISFIVLFWSGGILGRILIWFQEVSLKSRYQLVIEKNKAIENEIKFRALYDNAPDMYAIVSSPNLRILLCNETFYKNIGYEASEIIGTNIINIYHKSCQEQVKKDFKIFLETGMIKNKELQLQNKDGSVIEVSLNVNSVKDELGQELYLMFSWRDITEHQKAEKKLKQSEENFRLLVNNTFDGILISDSKGDYLYANKKAAEITGYSVDELLQINTKQLTPARFWDDVQKNIQEQFTNNNVSANFEAVLLDKWGKEVTTEIASSLTTWKGVKAQIIAFRDVTARKKFEQELIDAKQKAEESDRLKSAFLANMSHEIRTPMNGILGFTSLLQEPDLTGNQQQQYIEIIQKSGNRMLNTVNDIVEISRIETGQVQLHLKTINVIEQLENLVDFFTPEAEEKGLSLLFESDWPRSEATYKTDISKFNSIFTNLLKNALKFTKGGFVKLSCRRNNSELCISVTDTGIGIPRERQQAVFNRFEQADIYDVEVFEGSGLGLAIAKSYVEMLGGNIELESQPGKGSTFSVGLPVRIEPIDRANNNMKDTNIDKSTRNDLNILIAEDDESSYLYLSLLLKDYAKEIIWTKTGTETVEQIKQNSKIDLVLMDMKMPQSNGFEATQKIRSFNRDIVIIAQTAFVFEGDRAKSIEAGCNDFISKPINKKQLINLVLKYCNATKPNSPQ